MNSDLSDCNVGDAGGAVGVGAGEGEDFVKLFAEGSGEGAVPYSMNEDEAAVFLGIDGDELASEGADGEAVEFQFVITFAKADDGGRVVGVHHPDLLAHGKAFIPGVLLFLALEFYGALPRLVLLRFRLRFWLQAFLDDAEVFEVGEFHLNKDNHNPGHLVTEMDFLALRSDKKSNSPPLVPGLQFP